MPARIGITKAEEPKEKPEPEQEVLLHQRGLFKFGDKVRIVRAFKTKEQLALLQGSGYTSVWNDAMNWKLGEAGIVIQDGGANGYKVKFKRGGNEWWYPSFALELRVPKKRVRIKAGPWDAAPCTHLRWHLMGFFREKLVLVKQVVGETGNEYPVDSFTVRCSKCGTEMTLKAKG